MCNTPGVGSEDVADLALGLTLAWMRNISLGHRLVADGEWTYGNRGPMHWSLRRRRAGIVGLGSIGEAVAR